MIFFVVHSPHDGSDDAAKNDWWNLLDQLMQKYGTLGHVFCMGDFNSRLGEPLEGCIGDRLCSSTSDNGRRMIQLLESQHLWAPSTFGALHAGEDYTWTHPKGNHARLDYILCGLTDNLFVDYSYVDFDLQSSLTVRDHELVVLKVRIYKDTSKARPQQRRQYDWALMQTEWGKAQLQELVNRLPDVPWEEDVHVHWQILEDHLHESLQEFFPCPKKPKRMDLFSDKTKYLVKKRKRSKAGLLECDGAEHFIWFKGAMRTWHDNMTLADTGRRSLLELAVVEMARLFFLGQFRSSSKAMKSQIKLDKAAYIEGVVSKANKASGSDVFHALKPLRIGGRARRYGIPPLPGFEENGEPARDAGESDSIWLRHCSRMEAGVKTCTRRLLQRARKGSAARGAVLGERSLEDVPDLLQLEGAFRRIKKNKTGGVDDFRSDLCSLAAGPLAAKYHSLLQKIYLQMAEPIQMKGGTLIHAFKGGNPRRAEDFRGLLLSSHIGKALRRTFRQSLIPFYLSEASDSHFAIKAGGNVSQASQALRLFMSLASSRSESFGVLFLDIKSAYYRVIRQLLTSRGDDLDSIERVMQFFELGDSDPSALVDAIAERAEELQGRMELKQELLLEEMMSSTWFTSSKREELLESLAGSRPGDGLADVTFGLIFQKITRVVMSHLKETLEVEDTPRHMAFDAQTGPVEACEPPRLLEVVWADDLAIAYRSADASRIAQAMQTIVGDIFRECLRHGMVPNLKKGKTEVLIVPKGPGSKKVKSDLFGTGDPHLVIPDVPEDFQRVRLISQYRHLGTKVHVGTKLMVEIKARMGQAWTTYRKMRRQIFQNRLLGLSRRISLFRSLIMPIFEYNLGTWGPLQQGEFQYFSKRLHSLYRGLVRAEVHESELRLWNNDRVRAYLQLPSPQELLHGSRLRYSLSLYGSAPATLWTLIGCEGRWLACWREAQLWFLDQLKGYGPDKNGNDWRPDLHAWGLQNPKGMKKWIRRAEEVCQLNHARWTEWREWHFNTLQEMIEQGLQAQMPWPDLLPDQGEKKEACLRCGKAFTSKAAWSVHAFKVHGRMNRARGLIGGSRCEACEKEFHTSTRLQHHLCNSRRCYDQLLMAGQTFDTVLPGKNNTKEQKRPDFDLPPMRSEGPRIQALDHGLRADGPDIDDELAETITDRLLALDEDTQLEDCVDEIKQALQTSCNSFSEVRRTLTFWKIPLTEMRWIQDGGSPRIALESLWSLRLGGATWDGSLRMKSCNRIRMTKLSGTLQHTLLPVEGRRQIGALRRRRPRSYHGLEPSFWSLST